MSHADEVIDGAVVAQVVAHHLDGEALSVEPLEGGWSGAGVYRVMANLAEGQRELVVKLTDMGDALENDESRVYGTHPASVSAVHALLRSRGLPTYELLGAGIASAAEHVHWVAMSLLDGVPVHGHRPDQDPRGFQEMCGDVLGAIHEVTRTYDGEVDLATPYPSSWHDAFFDAFGRVVSRQLDKPGLADLGRRARRFAETRLQEWQPATAYSLSHVDGLQGHAVHSSVGWRFVGHVDLEDVVFLDARFALAGYELAHGGVAAAPFWEAYTSHTAVAPSYEADRAMLQLYLLIDWLWIEASRESLLAVIERTIGAS